MLYEHKRLGAKGAGARFERITGVEVAYIQKLARLSASTRKRTIGAGHGVNRHQNPDQIARGILVLPGITDTWCGSDCTLMQRTMPMALLRR